MRGNRTETYLKAMKLIFEACDINEVVNKLLALTLILMESDWLHTHLEDMVDWSRRADQGQMESMLAMEDLSSSWTWYRYRFALRLGDAAPNSHSSDFDETQRKRSF